MLKRPWSQINVGQVLQKYKGTTAAWRVTQQRVQVLHHQGLRAGLIARQLNAEGLPAQRGGRWTPGKVGIELRAAARAAGQANVHWAGPEETAQVDVP